MSMNQEIVKEREFLYVRCSGDYSLAEAKAKFLHIMEAVVEHQQSKVLVDVRQIKGSPTTLERYLYATFVADNVIRKDNGVWLAPRLVYLGQIPLIDPLRFGETVARNRGVDIKVYETREIKDALAWLGVAAPSSMLESHS